MTVGDRLEFTGGRPSGFDYLRISLSCLVIVFHGVGIAYGNVYADYLFRLPLVHASSMIVLPMFFALSGFLVAGSAARSKSLIGFLGNRAVRIYPALAVEVALSAFILGPIFTTIHLNEYFLDPQFLRYLVNITGHISYFLPGVFGANPVPGLVNRQLWTVPYELYCYLVISALMVLTLMKRPIIFALTVAALQCAYLAYSIRRGHVGSGIAGHIGGTQLVFSFLAGISLYLNRFKLPWNRLWGACSAVATVFFFSFDGGEFIGVFTAAYLTAYLGLTNFRKIAVVRGADYSYGVYLYGWPVQQALVATGEWARHWWVNVPLAIAITAGFAAISWHYVEKPALGAKVPLKALENRWLALRGRLAKSSTIGWTKPKRDAGV